MSRARGAEAELVEVDAFPAHGYLDYAPCSSRKEYPAGTSSRRRPSG